MNKHLALVNGVYLCISRIRVLGEIWLNAGNVKMCHNEQARYGVKCKAL